MSAEVSHLPEHVSADNPKSIQNADLKKGGAISALVPETLDDAFRLAKALSSAGDMVPQSFRGNPEATMAAIARGMGIGLAPMQALSNIAVINGRASLWGDALPALMQRAGHHVDVQIEGEGDQMKAVAKLVRGDTGMQLEREFSVEDAKKAGLWGKRGPWETYPKRMLMHRARSWAVRDGAADALMGLQIAEEVQDYQPMRDVTPKPATGAFASIAQQAKQTEKPEKAEKEATQEEITEAENIQGKEENTAETSGHWTDDIDASQSFPGSDAYDEGAKAGQSGKARDACPYEEDPERATDWLGGWDEAQKALI